MYLCVFLLAPGCATVSQEGIRIFAAPPPTQGARPLRDSYVSLADYRVERTEGSPADVKAGHLQFIKLVPTKADLTRTYELRPQLGSTSADMDAWVRAFTLQIAAAVACGGDENPPATAAPVLAAAADV